MLFASLLVWLLVLRLPNLFYQRPLMVIDRGLVYWQPRSVVLPATEGMQGYRNYRFHFRGFLIGIPVVLLGSALVSILVRARPWVFGRRRAAATDGSATSSGVSATSCLSSVRRMAGGGTANLRETRQPPAGLQHLAAASGVSRSGLTSRAA